MKRKTTESAGKQVNNMAEPIKVKITRADKRNRKIILVIESDLYSYETFGVNPFYDEGDEKNQLQKISFNIKVSEKKGKVNAEVFFGNFLEHFTRGYTQLHHPIGKHFHDRRDTAINWVQTVNEEWFNDDRIKSLLSHWEHNKTFLPILKDEIAKRRRIIKESKIAKAEKQLLCAISNMKQALKAGE